MQANPHRFVDSCGSKVPPEHKNVFVCKIVNLCVCSVHLFRIPSDNSGLRGTFPMSAALNAALELHQAFLGQRRAPAWTGLPAVPGFDLSCNPRNTFLTSVAVTLFKRCARRPGDGHKNKTPPQPTPTKTKPGLKEAFGDLRTQTPARLPRIRRAPLPAWD